MALASQTRRDGPVHPGTLAVGSGIALLLIAACLLRLWDLGGQSFENDELFSVFYSRRGFAYILGEGRWIETNPPLYYLLLSLWTDLFGDSEFAVRLLSVACSLATLPLVYRIGRILFDRDTGIFAAALFAFSGIHVFYAQEGRPYSLFILTVAVALLGCARIFRACVEPEHGIRPLILAAIPFVLGSILVLYAHSTGFVFMVAVDLMFLVSAAFIPRRKELLAVVILSNVLIAIAAAPQAEVLIRQSHSPNLLWIPHPTLRLTASILQGLMTGYPLAHAVKDRAMPPFFVVLAFAAVIALAALMILLSFRFLMRYRRDWPVMALCVVLPMIGLILLMAISHIRPILMESTAIWLTLPWYWVIGAGLAGIGAERRRLLLFAAVVALEAGLAVAQFGDEENEPWRNLVAEAAKTARPGDVFVLTKESHTGAGVLPFAYYWKDGALPELRRWEACPGGCPMTAEVVLSQAIAPAPAITLDEIDALLAQGQRVWIISRIPPGSEDMAEIEPLYRNLDRAAHATAAYHWQNLNFGYWQR
jgi:mannosyltransferase